MNMSAGSQRGFLACALLKQETTVRAQNAVRICVHCILTKKKRTCCFNQLPLQIFQANVRKSVKDKLKKGSDKSIRTSVVCMKKPKHFFYWMINFPLRALPSVVFICFHQMGHSSGILNFFRRNCCTSCL